MIRNIVIGLFFLVTFFLFVLSYINADEATRQADTSFYELMLLKEQMELKERENTLLKAKIDSMEVEIEKCKSVN